MSYMTGLNNVFINSGLASYLVNSRTAAAPPVPPVPPVALPFIFQWESTAPTQTLTLPLIGAGSYNFSVDWGDGSPPETITDYTLAYHEYTLQNSYVVTIDGQCTRWDCVVAPDADKILQVLQWGDIGITNADAAFYGCVNLTDVVETFWQGATSCSTTFYGCTSLYSIPFGLFTGCTEITTFYSCFGQCTTLFGTLPANLFDDCTQVTTFAFCFYGCTGIEYLCGSDMFRYNTLVQDDVFTDGFESTFRSMTSLVEIPDELFRYNTSIITFSTTFYGCTAITDIPAGLFTYNTNTESFAQTFQGCTALTSIPATLFDTNTAAVHFTDTFRGCTALTDVPDNLFDNNPVVYFTDCFNSCTSIVNCDCGTWDWTNVIGATGLFNGSTINTTDYDSSLIGIAGQAVQAGVTVDFGSSLYTSGGSAEAARDTLTDAPNSWTITDGGPV